MVQLDYRLSEDPGKVWFQTMIVQSLAGEIPAFADSEDDSLDW